MPEYRLCLVEQKDLEEAVQVLTTAMLPLPMHDAVFGGTGPEAAEKITEMFTALLTDNPGIVWKVRDNGRIIGVCRMKSCGGEKQNEAEPADRDEKDPFAVWRSAWDSRDPQEDHWHLGPIGVLPEYQGKGIGSILLTRFCREVDACGSPAYLETDREKSVGIYRKFGFEICAEEEILGVGNYYMWRPAKSYGNSPG